MAALLDTARHAAGAQAVTARQESFAMRAIAASKKKKKASGDWRFKLDMMI